MLTPTFADVVYGPHEKQKVDVWLPKGDGPFPFYVHYHGGGFCGGAKRPVNIDLLNQLLDNGVAAASVGYRFTDDPEYLAPLIDGQRGLQFLRHHADRFRLDKTRVGVGGGSAGAVTGFWIGFAPDRAQPQSADPIARESTRVTCIASYEAQTSIDPVYLRNLIPGPTWTIGSISALMKLKIDEYETPEGRRKFKEIECLDWIDGNTPPVFLFNFTADLPLNDQLEIGPGIHHPVIGRDLKKRLDPLGVECVLRTREEFAPEAPWSELYPAMFRSLGEFVVRKLKR